VLTRASISDLEGRAGEPEEVFGEALQVEPDASSPWTTLFTDIGMNIGASQLLVIKADQIGLLSVRLSESGIISKVRTTCELEGLTSKSQLGIVT
jgi:hypothetical protein